MDKLQELTEKLYDEGLAKGRAEGSQIVEKAKAEAAEILSSAKKEAESILSAAAKEAEAAKAKAESDIAMASAQALSATRSDIENLIVTSISAGKVSKTLADTDYLKEIITAVAKNFSSENPSDIALVLPENLKAQLAPFVENELPKVIGKGIEANFSKKIAGGFTIAPKDGGYFISLSDESFRNLIAEYLRPSTKKLLFG